MRKLLTVFAYVADLEVYARREIWLNEAARTADLETDCMMM